MKFYKIATLFLLPVIIFSCKKNTNDLNANVAASTILNVSYGTDALQNMDVYLPANRTIASTKVLIMIHGGAWESGDKIDFAPYVDTLKKRLPDYAIFNINYRLSAAATNNFPTQENDVKLAFQFIYGNASQYLISDKYVLLGASAGGHLAMLQAYKYATPVKPKAVVSFFGPSDLTEMYNNPAGGNPLISLILSQAIGKTPTQDPALYFNSSPVNFITAASAMPTILLHGGTDPLVNASQSVAVKNKLTAAGIVNQYVFYPTGGHGDWDNATYFDAFNKIEAFIRANVN
jgi:acetyl esterase/lipase